MQDLQGRAIRYLRLSLTRACGMRCVYCRPECDGPLDDDSPLSPTEIEQLARYLVGRHGLQKIRLTGGEPTARHDLIEIVERLSRLGLSDLGLTTNGLTLHRDARRLRQAGLKRINISLDSLDTVTFVRITGIDALDKALAGIDAALTSGLWPVKLNTVVMRGLNEDQLPSLVQFASTLGGGAEIRFIELMPMGPLVAQWQDRFVPESKMREELSSLVAEWVPMPVTCGSARRHTARLVTGLEVAIGFITPMSHPFCDACDRIRIASDGRFYPCLMDQPAADLLPALRPMFRPDLLDQLLQRGMTQKAAVHPANGYAPMIQLGG